MLYPRIIPCLLVKDKGLVKTVKFKDPKYVGDPINAVKIFNEKECDELMVIDIDATAHNREPDYKMIENIAAECRMPLCYGGGVKTAEQAQKIFNLGVEKIALSSAAIDNIDLVTEIAGQVGAQSIVVVLDVKKKLFGGYAIYTENGTRQSKIDLISYVQALQSAGIGELVINSIDQDGCMGGFDLNLIDTIKPLTHVPLTVLGGAGSIEDISKLIKQHGIIGISAGSLFVFKGKYRAVLINYPSPKEKKKMILESIDS